MIPNTTFVSTKNEQIKGKIHLQKDGWDWSAKGDRIC
jgi:hypothetical protein